MKLILKNIIYKLFSNKIFWIPLSPLRNQCNIVCFHRVLPKEQYDQLNINEREFSVTTDFFSSFLEFLSKKYIFCSLDQALNEDNSEKNLCHITFDDGYQDNLKHALPILKKFSAPATIYISDGVISRNISSTSHMCTEKINEFLSWDEVKRLDNEELIQIGSHTFSHAKLSDLTDEQLVFEVKNSKKNIEKALDHPIKHFAYPYGGKGTYSLKSIKAVKDAGFRSAATAISRKVNFSKNPYEIPRYFVTQNCTQDINLSRFSGIANLLHHQLLP